MRVTVPFQAEVEPMYLGAEHVLALVVEKLPKYPLLLHHNLWPLQLGDEELRQVATRLQQVDPGAQWHIMETSRGPRLLAAQRRRRTPSGESPRAGHS